MSGQDCEIDHVQNSKFLTGQAFHPLAWCRLPTASQPERLPFLLPSGSESCKILKIDWSKEAAQSLLDLRLN